MFRERIGIPLELKHKIHQTREMNYEDWREKQHAQALQELEFGAEKAREDLKKWGERSRNRVSSDFPSFNIVARIERQLTFMEGNLLVNDPIDWREKELALALKELEIGAPEARANLKASPPPTFYDEPFRLNHKKAIVHNGHPKRK